MGAEELVKHLAECRGVAAALVADGDATAVVQRMLAKGWTYQGEEVVEGKRVRYLVPPPELAERLTASLLYELDAGPEYGHRGECVWPLKICTGHTRPAPPRHACGGCSFATADPVRMDGHLNATGHPSAGGVRAEFNDLVAASESAVCYCDGAGRHMRGENCVVPAPTAADVTDGQARAAGLAAGGSMPGDRSGLAAALAQTGVADYGQPLTDFERRAAVREPDTDQHHYDTACDDRPYCRIPQHHEDGTFR